MTKLRDTKIVILGAITQWHIVNRSCICKKVYKDVVHDVKYCKVARVLGIKRNYSIEVFLFFNIYHSRRSLIPCYISAKNTPMFFFYFYHVIGHLNSFSDNSIGLFVGVSQLLALFILTK